MQLVPIPVLMPGICVICERSHQRDDRPWVDTGSEFDVGVVTFLTGRKYLCPECVGQAAELEGYLPPEKAGVVLAELEEMEADLKRLTVRDRDLAALERIIARAPEADEG